MSYQLSTLDNGLRIASEALPGMDSVALVVTVDVGARHEPGKDGGISHLLEHMAFKGTKRRSARDIAEEFDQIGGSLNAYTSMEHTVYHAKVLKNDLPQAVDLLADILQNSTFDETELAREREVILQEIGMHKDSPDDLILDYFHETAYPDQPLGRSILGLPERVAKFSRDDLLQYMGTHYHAPRMVISAAGNLQHDRLLQLVGEHFDLPKQQKPDPEPELAHYVGGDQRVEDDLEQLQVMLGWPGVDSYHPDYYAAHLAAMILGGGMSSRLFQEVREKRGLAYSISAHSTSYVDAGFFGIYCATGDDKSSELLPVLMQEMHGMSVKVSEEELRRAKNQQIAGLLMARESNATVAEWIGRHLTIFGRYMPVEEIRAKTEAVTVRDILRVCAGIGKDKRLAFAALGPVRKLPALAA